MKRSDLVGILRDRFPALLETDVPLAQISRWKIGGTADVLIHPSSIIELQQVRSFLYENGIPSVTIGATSNLLFSDEGLRAVGLHLVGKFRNIAVSNEYIYAGGSAWVPGLSRVAMKAGLSGLEHICGIPGTLGGLIYMNGGSQRKGIGDSVLHVTSVNNQGALVTRTRDDCSFAYRTSIFHGTDEVIAKAELRLDAGRPRRAIRANMLEILASRRKKFPRRQPNCGSVFVSDPEMYEQFGPPGQIIERLGLKGLTVGGAQVSTIHANFINNLGGARSRDVTDLIDEVRHRVYLQTGHRLRVEVRLVTPTGTIEVI